MTDIQAVPGRAAVLAVDRVQSSREGPNDAFWATERVPLAAATVLLAPGVAAAALGRDALIHGAPAWREAGLGETQRVRFTAPTWCYQILFWAGKERPEGQMSEFPGPTDIPVWVEAATGEIIEVDTDTLAEELQPQFDAAKRTWKDEDAPLAPVRGVVQAPKRAKGFLRSLTREWTSAVTDMVEDMRAESSPPPVGARPTEDDHPPIEGVDYRTWVTVKAGLERERVYPVHVDLYAGYRGVPSGRWAAVDAAWSRRAEDDPVLAGWTAFDLRRLKPTGSTWGEESGP